MLLRRLGIVTLIAISSIAGSLPGIAADLYAPVHVKDDRGGVMIDYALRVLEIKRDGTPVKVSGDCASACTLYLTLPPEQICITRSASFGFHLPYGTSASGNRLAASYLHRSYPAWIQLWIKDRGGLSKRMKTMDYRFASRFLQTCNENADNTGRLAAGQDAVQPSIY
jgi:hypothetical protein